MLQLRFHHRLVISFVAIYSIGASAAQPEVDTESIALEITGPFRNRCPLGLEWRVVWPKRGVSGLLCISKEINRIEFIGDFAGKPVSEQGPAFVYERADDGVCAQMWAAGSVAQATLDDQTTVGESIATKTVACLIKTCFDNGGDDQDEAVVCAKKSR
jgi:hypothetical protein